MVSEALPPATPQKKGRSNAALEICSEITGLEPCLGHLSHILATSCKPVRDSRTQALVAPSLLCCGQEQVARGKLSVQVCPSSMGKCKQRGADTLSEVDFQKWCT